MQAIKIHDRLVEHPTADYIILAGPTAVGKTETVMSLAEDHDIEIISGDSRQVYRYMDIGTATPDENLLRRFPHHLINELTPDLVWNAADFSHRARELIQDILKRNKLPVVIGGAGLYLDALRFGLFDERIKDLKVRQKYQRRVDAGEAESLWQELMELDPGYAETFHFNNHKKLMRAFEIYETTGLPPSRVFRQNSDPFIKKDLFIVLDRERSLLYERINHRVLDMLEQGLVGECQRLLELGYRSDLYPLKTIGYKEVFSLLSGEIDQAEMIRLIQKNTRNFAKRQLTWFRNHPFDEWIDLDNNE